MAFTISASQWNDEVGDLSKIILKPILGARTMDFVDKYSGLTGENLKLPVFETTTPWQAGASCGYSTSGTTTISQFTITTSPITINESICLNDLETYFTKAWLPNGSKYESAAIVSTWVDRKIAQTTKFVEQALWQGKTTYTNDTHLKQINGFISVLDTAGTAVAATQQASITTSTVRGIFEDILFSKLYTIPEVLNEKPIVFCGQDTFAILQLKLMQDNLYHYAAPGSDLDNLSMTYPGTNAKIVGVPGLNASNGVEVGALPTAVKNRIFATYQSNLCVGFNAENDSKDCKVWFSPDTDLLKLKMRFHLGVAIKYPSLVVQYTNS